MRSRPLGRGGAAAIAPESVGRQHVWSCDDYAGVRPLNRLSFLFVTTPRIQPTVSNRLQR